MSAVTCIRCGREGTPQIEGRLGPEDWEGNIDEAVCPGCQYAEWHPHCTALRVECGNGDRVDIEALERGESVTVAIDGAPVLLRSRDDLKALEEGELGWCDYIDLSISWTDDDEPPSEWRCPSCGGTDFEGVHRDYQGSNLKGTTFTTELHDLDED